MRGQKPLYVVLVVLAAAALACNLPANVPATPAPTATQVTPPNQPSDAIDIDIALTMAVQTLAAATQTAAIPTETITPGPPPPTPVVAPTVSVNTDTNCRTGPGISYDLVMVFKVGMSANVVGRYTPDNYWIIQYPGGNGATCWLWGAYATVLGNVVGLPEGVPPALPPTATPAPQAPNPPKGVHTACTSVNKSHKVGDIWIISWEWTVKLSWKDESDNEDGFSIYKDGNLLATVGPNQTSYTDVFNTFLIIDPVTYVYGVQSYNDYGASVIKDIELSTCD